MTNALYPVWLNGALVSAEAAQVALSDRGFLLGDGVFETMLWRGTPGIARFEAHMARLSHAASTLGLVTDIDETAIRDAIATLCADSPAPLALRLSLSRGSGPRGLAVPERPTPVMAITASSWSQPGPVRNLVGTSIPRAPGAPSARFKTLSYMDNVEALRQARAAGGDDGIMVGTAGQPVCATAANLIVERDGSLLTPPLAEGALPGITRGSLIAAGLVRECSLHWADLEHTDAVATTNALTGPRAVLAVNGRVLQRSLALTAHLHNQIGAVQRVEQVPDRPNPI